MDTTPPVQARNHALRLRIDGPTPTEDATIGFAYTDVEILRLVAIVRGSASPRVDWNIRFDSTPDRTAAGTPVLASDQQTTSETSGDSLTPPFDEGSIPAGSWIWVETSNIVGVVEEFFVEAHIDGIA